MLAGLTLFLMSCPYPCSSSCKFNCKACAYSVKLNGNTCESARLRMHSATTRDMAWWYCTHIVASMSSYPIHSTTKNNKSSFLKSCRAYLESGVNQRWQVEGVVSGVIWGIAANSQSRVIRKWKVQCWHSNLTKEWSVITTRTQWWNPFTYKESFSFCYFIKWISNDQHNIPSRVNECTVLQVNDNYNNAVQSYYILLSCHEHCIDNVRILDTYKRWNFYWYMYK